MRSVDGRPLVVERVLQMGWKRHGKGSSYVPLDTLALCTTPCTATLPSGLSLLNIVDVATQHSPDVVHVNLATNSAIDFAYTSHQREREHERTATKWGAVIGAVVGYVGSALIFRVSGADNWHYYSADIGAAAYTTVLGVVIGAYVGGANVDFSDRVVSDVHPELPSAE